MSIVQKINIVLALLTLSVAYFNYQSLGEVTPLERIWDNSESISYPSQMLSKFWNQSMSIDAKIILPLSYGFQEKKMYPLVLHFHGLGGTEFEALKWKDAIHQAESKRSDLEMIHVFVRTSFFAAYHSFIDSECSGPWGTALITEFIPALERNYRISTDTKTRFLTGHSSGAWTALWLQIKYPKLFGGAWASSPDPLDFRSFYGINLTPESTDNVYRDLQGNLRPYSRIHGVSLQKMIQPVEGNLEVDTEFDSDEWKWSGCDLSRRPKRIFNRDSGDLNKEVLMSWERYDLRKVIAKNWKNLRGDLHGKIHIVCGEQDTYFLELPTKYFCQELGSLGENDACLFVPDRTHLDMYLPAVEYPEGLLVKFLKEMVAS